VLSVPRPMSDSDSVWYRLGYSLERSRHPSVPEPLRSLADRGRELVGRDEDVEEADPEPAEEEDGGTMLEVLLTASAGTLAARVLSWWTPRRKPGVAGMIRGAIAGAGAAYLRTVLQPLLRGRLGVQAWDEEMSDLLLEGTARGILYAAVLDGRLPGGPLSRGALYGVLEYAVSPWGGLEGILGKRAPHRRVPVVGGLLERDRSDEEETLVEHVAFAVALGLFYGHQGIPVVEDEED